MDITEIHRERRDECWYDSILQFEKQHFHFSQSQRNLLLRREPSLSHFPSDAPLPCLSLFVLGETGAGICHITVDNGDG